MLDMAVVVAICCPRRCRGCGSAGYGTQTPADCRTDARAMPAASNRADYSPGASPQQPAANCSLGRIIGIS